MLCKYGCGQVGRYETNGSYRCSEHWQSCPAQKSKQREIHLDHAWQRKHPVKKGLKPWHTGKKLSSLHRKKISIGMQGKSCPNAKTPEKELEKRSKLRKIAIERGYGGYIKGSGRGKGQWYTSKFAGKVYLDSSYEFAYARFLDESEIDWRKNRNKFPYQWEGKTRFYIPDFWLVMSDEYIEVKGYVTPKDQAKWDNFPHKLTVLKRSDLKALGLKIK